MHNGTLSVMFSNLFLFNTDGVPYSTPEIAYFMRKTTYSNRKLPYRALINTLLLILILFYLINVVFTMGYLISYVRILIVATLV